MTNASLSRKYDYSTYQPFQKIEEELHRIINATYSTRLFSIGKTFENRSLWAIKFSRLSSNKTAKKTIVLDCGAHAREWVAPATCMHIIKQFSDEVDSLYVTNLTKVLRKYDWVIVPLLNPDGYVYTWHNQTTRLWRKNRSYTKKQLHLRQAKKDELCIGVDVNRNFDKIWGGPGAPVNDPCKEMYAGPEAFSEKESASLARYLNSTKKDIIAYVSMHSFGQFWMTPWGYTKTLPKNYSELKRVATLSANAIENFSGNKYSVGSSYKKMYPNSGSSVDWAYSEMEIPYCYIVEMMPKKKTDASFLVPPPCMVKNAKDMIIGLKTMAESLASETVELL